MPTIEIDALSLDECLTRKDKLEAIASRGAAANPTEAAVAWHSLMQFMLEMSLPDTQQTPKFNDLLISIWRSLIRAKLEAAEQASTVEQVNKTTPPPPTSEKP